MPQPQAAGTSPSLPVCILDAVLALDLALERRALYPAAHPLVTASRDAYVRAWKGALTELGSVHLWIAAGRLGWGVGEINTLPGPRFEPLSRLLHSMHLTGIEADREASGPDLLALLDLIQSLRFDPRPLETIQRWQHASVERPVRVVCLDVDSFRYGDRRLDAPTGEIWAGLHQYLAGGSSEPAGVARALVEMLQDQELMGLGTLRAEIQDRLERAGPDGEGELSDRIRRLLVAFPESVRADLLRIDAPAGSSLLARLVRSLPVRDALSSLLQLGHVGGKVPKGTTTILTQILHCLPDGESVSRAVLGPPSAEPVDVVQVACALESVFSSRTDQDFNPEDYQRRLDELSRQENLDPVVSPRRAELLSDKAGLTVQVAGIATMSLAEAAADEARSLLEYLERGLAGLLERERLDLLAVAARAIRAQHREDTDVVGRIAARLAERLETLFSLGAAAEGNREDLGSVLALLPPDLVGQEALSHLLAPRPRFDPSLLHGVLLARDGHVLAALLADAVAAAPDRVNRVRPLLRGAQSHEVRELLGRLLTHDDPRVRRTVLTIAVEQDGVSHHLATLERAISDPDGEIARWALQCLASSPEGATDVTELLGGILEMRGTQLSDVVSSRIVSLLVQRGHEGIHRAAVIVDRFRRRPRLRSARLASVIVVRLAPFRKDPEVRRILNRWNWSLARLLGALPGGGRGDAHA